MKNHVRAAVAAIAIAHSSGRSVSAIHGPDGYANISVEMRGDQVTAYDYVEGAHISGTLGSLYHYGEGSHLQIQGDGPQYTGYDYGAGDHFQIRVNGRGAQVYDYGSGSWSSYSA